MMVRFRRAALLTVLAMPLVALANGFDSANVNPRDLALAGSAVAAQTTAAAAYVNPAALAKLSGLQVDTAVSMLDLHTAWTDPTGGSIGANTSTKFSPTPPPSLSVGYGATVYGRPAGVGLALDIPAGGNMEWPDDWAGRYRVILAQRRMYGLYAGGGVEVVKNLRLGGSLVYVYTTEHLRQAFTRSAPDLLADLKASGGGFGFDVSGEYSPLEGLTFALDYKHKVGATLKGDVTFENVPAALAGIAKDQGVSHAITIPNYLNAGVAYRAVPSLTLTFGYSLGRYIQYQQDTFVGDAGTFRPIVVPRDYHNGQTFRLGAEWSATERLTLRGGILRDLSGLPTTSGDGLVSPTYSPTLPDSNSWGYSAGAGWAFRKGFAIQAGVYYVDRDRISSSATADVAGGPFPGSYKTNVWIYSLGVSWNRAPTVSAEGAPPI